MREKLEQLRDKISELKERTSNCEHEWGNPVYDPDLFDGIDRWIYTCTKCGEKLVTLNSPLHEDGMSR